jgi:hypothetical protein
MAGRTGAEFPEKLEGIDACVVTIGEADGEGVVSDEVPGERTDIRGNVRLLDGPLPRPFIDAGGAGAGKTEKTVQVKGFVAIPPEDADGL